MVERFQEHSANLEDRISKVDGDIRDGNDAVLPFGELRCIYCHEDFYKEPDTHVSVLRDAAGSYLHQDCGKQSQLPVKKLNATYSQLVHVLQEEYAKNKSISPRELYALAEKRFAPWRPQKPLDKRVVDAASIAGRYTGYVIGAPFFIADKLYEKGYLAYPEKTAAALTLMSSMCACTLLLFADFPSDDLISPHISKNRLVMDYLMMGVWLGSLSGSFLTGMGFAAYSKINQSRSRDNTAE